MASLLESPQAVFVPRSEHPTSSNHPVSSPFRLPRLVLPIFCVSIGVSVGFATGFTLALVKAPNEIVAASSDSARASRAPLAANLSQPATATVHTGANSAVAKMHAPTAVQIARNKIPDAVKPAMFKLDGKEWRVAMPIAIPVGQPIRQGMAITPAASSTALLAQHG